MSYETHYKKSVDIGFFRCILSTMNSQKLLIPSLSTQLELVEDWTFILHLERRNTDLWNQVKPSGQPIDKWDVWRSSGQSTPLTLPKGTFLSVDRIFIRRGSVDFNSVSFRILKGSPKFSKTRFWAKLNDVNTMEVIVYEKQ